MNKRKIGAEYEMLAAEYLMAKGFTILEKNYWTPYGEIDILAKEDNILVFCEVKYRKTEKCGSPLEAVDVRKQKKISRAALYYYSRHGFQEGIPCRFDVLSACGNGKIEHLENAFEFSYSI
jgi:putative endonuclease